MILRFPIDVLLVHNNFSDPFKIQELEEELNLMKDSTQTKGEFDFFLKVKKNTILQGKWSKKVPGIKRVNQNPFFH